MKKVLILCDDYYPSSRATIAITQRFAEGLVRKGYDVSVMTIRERINPKPDYPKEKNGVKIFDYSEFENRISTQEQQLLQRLEKRQISILKRTQRMKRIKVNSDNLFAKKWNHIIEKLRDFQKEYSLRKTSKKIHTIHRANIIDKYLSSYPVDIMISVSGPFSTNTIASYVKEIFSKNLWISICFDPYAYDEVQSIKEKKIRRKEENKTFENCDAIMYLSQFSINHNCFPYKERIVYFDLPNIRKLEYCSDYPVVPMEKEKINCLFLGNLYSVYRRPDFLFRLIERLNEECILYLVGNLIGIKESYIREWEKRLKGKMVYHKRVGQEAAINSMLSADVLINIGNVTKNQCPSKIIDYISTGKPILNISVIEDCTSKQCLSKYPLKYNISEKDKIDTNELERINAFITNAKKKTVPFSDILKLYKGYTIDSMVEKFISIIEY